MAYLPALVLLTLIGWFQLFLFKKFLGFSAHVQSNSDALGGEAGLARKRPEDSIPVIELRGESKPMTSAQIRALEETSNGGPLDIKVCKN